MVLSLTHEASVTGTNTGFDLAAGLTTVGSLAHPDGPDTLTQFKITVGNNANPLATALPGTLTIVVYKDLATDEYLVDGTITENTRASFTFLTEPIPISDDSTYTIAMSSNNVSDDDVYVNVVAYDLSKINLMAVSGDSTAANNLEADYDGTGYNKANSTIGTVTTNTDMRGTDSAATAASVTALNNISAAEVNEQVDAAIVTYGLDHLVFTSVSGSDVADDSIIAKLADDSSPADFSNHNSQIKSLGAISNRITNISGDTGNTIPTAISALETKVDAIDGIVDDILTDTGTSLPSTLSTITTLVGNVLVDTDTTIPAMLSNLSTSAQVVAVETKVDDLIGENHYQIEVAHVKDDAQGLDEYTISFFKNTTLLTSGVSSISMSIIKREDGTVLFSTSSLTQIGATGTYKHDESSNRVLTGETYLVFITATIDGSPRVMSKLIARDA